MDIKRGDIYYADLGDTIGCEQKGFRPVVIIQNDTGNKFSPTVIVAAITSSMKKAKLPVHVEISEKESSLPCESVILLEQIRTIDKTRLLQKISTLDVELLNKINNTLKISLDID